MIRFENTEVFGWEHAYDIPDRPMKDEECEV